MPKFNNNKISDVVWQFVTFRTALQIVTLVAWAYYYILIYILSGSIELIILENIFYNVGIWVGFVLGSFLIDRIGYLRTFQLSSFLQVLSFASIILLFDDLVKFLFLIAIFRGFSRGPFWATSHAVMLKEVKDKARGEIINTLISLFLVLGIIIPPLVGGYLSLTGDYKFIFIVSAAVYLIATIFPFKHNRKPKSKITGKEITQILKHKNFGKFFIASFLHDGAIHLTITLFLIIPFLLLKDELIVGILGSIIAFTAAVFGYIERKRNLQIRIIFGYIGFFIYFIVHLLLGFIWSIPMLILRSLGQPLTDTMGESVRIDLDYRFREKLIDTSLEESAIEMNLVVETIYLFARCLSSLSVLIILNSFSDSHETPIRIVLIFTSFVPLIVYRIFVESVKDTEQKKVKEISVITSKHSQIRS